MTSERRAEANRVNAQASTGPRTTEGKARSRRNAYRHGLTGKGVVRPAEEAKVYERRLADWRRAVHPKKRAEVWLVEKVVVASLRIDRCHVQEASLREQSALRAENFWDADRALEAEQLGELLPANPRSTVLKLSQTLHGCDWLIARWRELAHQARTSGWSADHFQRALDLLSAHDSNGIGPETPPAQLVQLAEAEIAKLEVRKLAPLTAHDDYHRGLAEDGLVFDSSPPARLLHRYEESSWRNLKWCLRELRTLQAERKEFEDDDDELYRPRYRSTAGLAAEYELARREASMSESLNRDDFADGEEPGPEVADLGVLPSIGPLPDPLAACRASSPLASVCGGAPLENEKLAAPRPPAIAKQDPRKPLRARTLAALDESIGASHDLAAVPIAIAPAAAGHSRE